MEFNESIKHTPEFKEHRLKDEALTETNAGISSNTFAAHTSAESEPKILCCGCNRPMMLIGVENTTLCYICKAAPSTYVCAPCSNGLINFFDRECAELPREIDYPYHHHALRLSYRRNCDCSACLRRSDSFNFGCERCKFVVDVNCALREQKAKPSI